MRQIVSKSPIPYSYRVYRVQEPETGLIVNNIVMVYGDYGIKGGLLAFQVRQANRHIDDFRGVYDNYIAAD
jgi:hypothetical protein